MGGGGIGVARSKGWQSESPDREWRYNCSLPLTSTLERGGVVSNTPLLVPTEWALGPILMGMENLPPHRDSIPVLSSL